MLFCHEISFSFDYARKRVPSNFTFLFHPCSAHSLHWRCLRLFFSPSLVATLFISGRCNENLSGVLFDFFVVREREWITDQCARFQFMRLNRGPEFNARIFSGEWKKKIVVAWFFVVRIFAVEIFLFVLSSHRDEWLGKKLKMAGVTRMQIFLLWLEHPFDRF